MNFLAPYNIWSLCFVVAVLCLMVLNYRLKKNIIHKIISKELWAELMPKTAAGRLFSRNVMVLLVLFFICLALMRPHWGYSLQEVKKKGVDIFILVDVSDSMRAQDIKPSRIERSKRELVDLLGILEGDRVGLIPFAGDPYVACPLTTDYEVFDLFISELSPDLIPTPGTDLAAAINLAVKSFDPVRSRAKAIILLTDGEITLGELGALSAELAKNEIRVFVIGLGDTRGAPVPKPGGDGFIADAKGNLVISKLDEEGLQWLAQETGGTYVRSVTGDLDLEQIYLKGIKKVLEADELKSGMRKTPLERFQIPLLLGFIFLLLEPLMGWGKKGIVCLIFFISMGSGPSHAWDLLDFERANQAYDKKEYDQAGEGYRSLIQGGEKAAKVHYNLGNTLYRQGKYQEAGREYTEALNSGEQAIREDSLYNLGGALYRQDQLQEAVSTYDRLLEMNPDHQQGRLNRDFILKKIAEQKQAQNEEKKQEESKQEKKEEQKSDQEQNSNEQKQEQASHDQEKKSDSENDPSQPDQQNSADSEKQKADGQAQKQEQEAANGDQKSADGDGKKMSRNQAEQWLNALEDDPEGALRDMIKRQLPLQPKRIDKPW